MSLVQINASPLGLTQHGTDAPPQEALLQSLTGAGPVIVMVHGYKFAPYHRHSCPHNHILSLHPRVKCWKALSWPQALGVADATGTVGIAFGWPARGRLRQVYHRAEEAGRQLAELVSLIRQLAPHRPIYAIAHSLGARVVLKAVPHLAPQALRRVLLMNGADFSTTAETALACPAGAALEVINVTSRENDLFDCLLEWMIRADHPGDTALSLAMPQRRNTLTIQLDHGPALARFGFPIAAPSGRICHWSTYLRPGVFPLYRALTGQEGLALFQNLRHCLPQQPDPRWSRLTRLSHRLPGGTDHPTALPSQDMVGRTLRP